jgi:lipopolysaccharide export system protein LptA
MIAGRSAILRIAVTLSLVVLPAAVSAQGTVGAGAAPAPGGGTTASGLALGGPNDRRPLDIQADDGIEWQQNNNVYIAHGNARATRGTASVFADTLIAYYRPTAPGPKPAASEASASSTFGSSQIYRVEAEGNVRIATETQTIYGDHAIYDLDRAIAVVTGKHLRLVTPRDTVTARDTLEWYDTPQVAVARGDAVAIQNEKRLAGDVLTAQVVKSENGTSRISRIDAQGHVLVSTINEIARGNSGVYNVDTGIATLAGAVTITREGNELRGQYGVVDLNKNVSRLLSAPPGSTQAGPVQGLIVPKPTAKPASPGQDKAAPGKTGAGQSP